MALLHGKHPAWLLALLAGCGGDCPPPEVKGDADPQQLAAARRAVDAFFARLPGDAAVCVSAVKLGRTSGEHGGWYRTVDRRIKISDDAPPEEVELATHHELCHAADLQLDLRTIDDRDLWSFASGWGGFGDDRNGSRVGAREAFAYTCQMGPGGYDRLAGITCPGDHLEPELSWLADVYGEPAVTRLTGVALASVPSPSADQITVYADGALRVDDAWFELETGASRNPSHAAPLDPEDFEAGLLFGSHPFSSTLGHGWHWKGPTGTTAARVETDEGIGCLPDQGWERILRDPEGRMVVFVHEEGVLSWSRYEPVVD